MGTEGAFTVSVSGGSKGATIAVGGEIDLAVADDFAATLRSESEAGRSVLLDLRRVSFMDAAGLTTVLRAITAAKERGVPFALATPLPDSVTRLARITGVLPGLPLATR